MAHHVPPSPDEWPRTLRGPDGTVIGPDGLPVIFYVDEDGNQRVHSQTIVCDFCCAPEPSWSLPVGPVRVDVGLVTDSDDDWAVCDGCRPFIEGRDISGLATYAADRQIYNAAIQGEMNESIVSRAPPRYLIIEALLVTFNRVFAAIKGPLEPWEP